MLVCVHVVFPVFAAWSETSGPVLFFGGEILLASLQPSNIWQMPSTDLKGVAAW